MTSKVNRRNLVSLESSFSQGDDGYRPRESGGDAAEPGDSELQSQYVYLVENMNSAMAIYKAVDDGQDFVFVDFNRAGERIDNIRRDGS